MKAISINAARRLGDMSGARRVVILAMNGDDYCITTWGATRADCRLLAQWAESDKAVAVLGAIADGELDGGVISVARAPEATSEIGVE